MVVQIRGELAGSIPGRPPGHDVVHPHVLWALSCNTPMKKKPTVINVNCVPRVTLGTNEMGNQWEQGGKGYTENCMNQWDVDQWEFCTHGYVGKQRIQGRNGYTGSWGNKANKAERVTLGDQWDGDQWELCIKSYVGGPMRWPGNQWEL